MSSEAEIVQARAEAEIARAQLMQQVHAIQTRLAPNTLVNDVIEAARDKGGEVIDGAARAAAQRPAVASAAALGLVALLARKPIARLIARFRNSDGD